MVIVTVAVLAAAQSQPATVNLIKDNRMHFSNLLYTSDSVFDKAFPCSDTNCYKAIDIILSYFKPEYIENYKDNLRYITDSIFIDLLVSLIDYPLLSPDTSKQITPRINISTNLPDDRGLIATILIMNTVPFNEIEKRTDLIKIKITNALLQRKEAVTFDSMSKNTPFKLQLLQLLALTDLSESDKKSILSYRSFLSPWVLARAGDTLSRKNLINKFNSSKEFKLKTLLAEDLNKAGDTNCLIALVKGIERPAYHQYENGICRSSNYRIFTELARRFPKDSIFSSRLKYLLDGVHSLCDPVYTLKYFKEFQIWAKLKYGVNLDLSNQVPSILKTCTKSVNKTRYCDEQ